MEWNGMVRGNKWNKWNGMEWNGMEWNGMDGRNKGAHGVDLQPLRPDQASG
jgi:hypothetical protein